MSKSSKALNLKDKLSGNEMDLSLCNLSEVPVKELVSQLCLLIVNLKNTHTSNTFN